MHNLLKRVDDLHDPCFDKNIQFDPAAYTVETVEPIKIFYCFYGRNAWHSTWIQRYTKDSMHTTRWSAQLYAEDRRVQGSVFYIEELPSLCISGGNLSVYITQINADRPLSGYSATALRSTVPVGVKKIADARDNYLEIGAPLFGTILSFENGSRFWSKRPRRDNSIIVLYSKSSQQRTVVESERCIRWKSRSYGKSISLGWTQIESRIDGSAVLRLCKAPA